MGRILGETEGGVELCHPPFRVAEKGTKPLCFTGSGSADSRGGVEGEGESGFLPCTGHCAAVVMPFLDEPFHTSRSLEFGKIIILFCLLCCCSAQEYNRTRCKRQGSVVESWASVFSGALVCGVHCDNNQS